MKPSTFRANLLRRPSRWDTGIFRRDSHGHQRNRTQVRRQLEDFHHRALLERPDPASSEVHGVGRQQQVLDRRRRVLKAVELHTALLVSLEGSIEVGAYHVHHRSLRNHPLGQGSLTQPLLQIVPSHHPHMPRLRVPSRRRPPKRFEQTILTALGQRRGCELANAATGTNEGKDVIDAAHGHHHRPIRILAKALCSAT